MWFLWSTVTIVQCTIGIVLTKILFERYLIQIAQCTQIEITTQLFRVEKYITKEITSTILLQQMVIILRQLFSAFYYFLMELMTIIAYLKRKRNTSLEFE